MRLDSVDRVMMVVALQCRPGFPSVPPVFVGRAVLFRFLSGRAAFSFAAGMWYTCRQGPSLLSECSSVFFCFLWGLFSCPDLRRAHSVHSSTFLWHCGNPCGSRRFALQCRWARFALGHVLWYTGLRPRAIFGLILSIVVVARGFFIPSLGHAKSPNLKMQCT